MTAALADARPELSIVIPCFNEVENVAAITAAVRAEARLHADSHEIILIDNGSTDGTRSVIRALCRADPDVRAIFNTRNFGQMRSPTHGIYQARGQAVIGMCADFQDPPALIGEFLRHWRNGTPIVLAQRRTERTAPGLGLARAIGYALIGRLADHPVIPNVTGFGLFDRRVVDVLARWNEPEPFFRGMLIESGFAVALVPFDRPERAAGESKNGIASLLAFALSGLTGSAKSLLRAPIILSLFAGLGAIGLIAAGLIALPLAHGLAGSLLTLGYVTALFTVLLLFLGLIGDQVRLIAERTRAMPLVIEEERLNFPDSVR